MLKPNFKDKRGTITDLMVTPYYSITHITFKKGAVRGNHLHQKTTQFDFILKGQLRCVTSVDSFIIGKGETIEHSPGIAHAYKAMKDSEMISICFGVRKGIDYEKDTYRLPEEDKLI